MDGRSARLLLSPYELRELTSLDDRQCFVAPLVTFGLIAVFVTLGLLALYSEAWFLLIVALLAIATHQVDEKVSLAEKRRLRDEG